MKKFIIEHKQISFFVISMFIFYFFTVVPVENLNSNINNLKNKQKRFAGMVSSEKIIKDNLEKLKEEKEKLIKQYTLIQEKEIKYNSLGEFQNKFDIFLKENRLKTLEIGRTFFEGERYRVLYVTEGKEEDVINFLLKTDNLKNINIFKTPLELKKKEKNIELRFGVEIKIKNRNEDIKNNIKRKIFMNTDLNKYELIKFNLLGKEKGIFYIKNNDVIKRYYFKNKEKEIFNNKLCKIEILEKELIIENLESDKKIIFYLGDNIGENNKKD